MYATNAFQYNLIIREILNGALLPLSVSLAVILSVSLFETWRRHGPGWTSLPGIKVSCAMWWLFLCEAIRAGIVWVLLRIQNDNQVVPCALDFAVNIGFVFGASGLIVAFLRCIYLITPPRWGHTYWLLTVTIMASFLLLSHIFPPFPLPAK